MGRPARHPRLFLRESGPIRAVERAPSHFDHSAGNVKKRPVKNRRIAKSVFVEDVPPERLCSSPAISDWSLTPRLSVENTEKAFDRVVFDPIESVVCRTSRSRVLRAMDRVEVAVWATAIVSSPF